MRFRNLKPDPNVSSGLHWEIAVGLQEAPLGLHVKGELVCTVWAYLRGPKRGKIEIFDPRVTMSRVLTPEEAETLAATYDHESCPGQHRVEAALLDAAHLIREFLGQPSQRKAGRMPHEPPKSSAKGDS